MKYFSPKRAFWGILLLGILFSPSAYASSKIFTSWENPTQYSFYTFGSHVFVSGTYVLPPDWAGDIYVRQDGNLLTWPGAIGTPPNHIYVQNLGNLSSKTVPFVIDLGTQPGFPDPHIIGLEFFGGEKCFILKECEPDDNNWAYERPNARTYTAADSVSPKLKVTEDLAGLTLFTGLTYNAVTVGTPDTRTLYVRNTGGGVATGVASVPGGEPFSCLSNCTYSLASGAVSPPILIQYLPLSQTTANGVVDFSCTSIDCAGVSGPLSGTGVASVLPPQLELSDSSLQFGTIFVGYPTTDIVTVSNSGGGRVTGTVSFDDPAYTCLSGCNYDLANGDPQDVTIQFNPTNTTGIQTYNKEARFTSNAGEETLPLLGRGSALPETDINCQGCDSDGGSQYHWNTPVISPGQTDTQIIEMRNIGVGVLSGKVNLTPTLIAAGYHCVSVEQNGVKVTYTDASPCLYSGLIRGGDPALITLEYTPPIAEVGFNDKDIRFTNDQDPTDWDDLRVTSEVSLDARIEITYISEYLEFADSMVNFETDKLYSSYQTAKIQLKNLSATPATIRVNLPAGAGVFTCKDPSQCNQDFILAANGSGPSDTVTIIFKFKPTDKKYFEQEYAVCVDGACSVGAYFLDGYGVKPMISAETIIPGGSVDNFVICGQSGNKLSNSEWCGFTGKKTVYYGNGLKFSSKEYTGGVNCWKSNFPPSGYTDYNEAYCWIARDELGTWTNRPWKTFGYLNVTNSNDSGFVLYRVVSNNPFICEEYRETYNGNKPDYCGGHVRGNGDTDQIPFFFNPTVPGLQNGYVRVEYNYTADVYLHDNNTLTHYVSDCPDPKESYCNFIDIPLTGTGLAGPHLAYTVDPFPNTNVDQSSSAALTVRNDGTEIDNNITVDYIDGPFSCTLNCGIASLGVNNNFVAQITFSPAAVDGGGTKTGHFRINSSNAPSIDVAVTAVANALPVMVVTPGTAYVEFGKVGQSDVVESGNGTIAAIFVSNTGVGDLFGTAVLNDETDYRCTPSCSYGPIPPGQTREIKIKFIPSKPIPNLQAQLTVSGNGGSSVIVTLHGEGELGASNLSGSGGSFGDVVVRTGNFKQKDVRIKNNGSSALPAGEIYIDNSVFTCVGPTINPVTGNCTYPIIAPGATFTFQIKFTPVAKGPVVGDVKFVGMANVFIPLSGTGVIPSVKFKEIDHSVPN